MKISLLFTPTGNNYFYDKYIRTSFLQCSKCGRKSWSGEINAVCEMSQPDGRKCDGLLEGKKE